MKRIDLTDAQYDVLIEALVWAEDATDTDLENVESNGPYIYKELRDAIVAQVSTKKGGL